MVVYIAIAVIVVVAAILFFKQKKREKKMPAGIQVHDGNGNVVLDMTSRVSKILGTVTTNGANGSLTDARLLDGTMWAAIERIQMAGTIYSIVGLEITASGSRLSWSHKNTWGADSYNITFVYGIY